MAEEPMPVTLAETCEQLDEILVQQLELVQDYINLSLENEQQMKDGFFHIARARYNTGSQSLSKICFPTEDVEQNFVADVTVTNLQGNNHRKRSLQVSNMSASKTEDGNVAKSIASQFGVLKSPSLKVAETRFRSCLDRVIERANTLSELECARDRYSLLMMHKKKLELLSVSET